MAPPLHVHSNVSRGVKDADAHIVARVCSSNTRPNGCLTHRQLKPSYMRIVVGGWDEKYIFLIDSLNRQELSVSDSKD
jgi:hypothetical protein